jgi:extradiol dioxygenase family protein
MSKELMESYYQTYNSENPDKLREFYCEDVVLTSGQGAQEGVQSIIDMYSYLISVFSDQMTPQSIEVDGNTAVVDILDQFEAKTDIEDFMGMSLSKGDKFELRIKGSYEIENGKFKNILIEQQV